MSAACIDCGAVTLPLGDDDRCMTCRTLDLTKHPSGLPNASANGNGAGRAQVADAISARAEVDGGELLDDVARFIERFQVLPSREVADLLALWVLHTHSFEAAWATPYLRITSAAPESGKTQLLEILATLVRRGWHAVNPSVAVLYRKIDRRPPTLLLDEMDNYPRRGATGRAVGAERRLQARRHDRPLPRERRPRVILGLLPEGVRGARQAPDHRHAAVPLDHDPDGEATADRVESRCG